MTLYKHFDILQRNMGGCIALPIKNLVVMRSSSLSKVQVAVVQPFDFFRTSWQAFRTDTSSLEVLSKQLDAGGTVAARDEGFAFITRPMGGPNKLFAPAAQFSDAELSTALAGSGDHHGRPSVTLARCIVPETSVISPSSALDRFCQVEHVSAALLCLYS